MRILIVGQIPPPFHGSNVMAETLFEVLKQLGHEVNFIDKSFSSSMSEVSKPSIRKLFRVPVLMTVLFKEILRKFPGICIYFISLSPSAFVVDALMLTILRLFRVPYVLRFGAKGVTDLATRGNPWRSLVALSLKRSLGGIVKANALKKDVNTFIPNERIISVPNCIPNQNLQIRTPKDDDVVQVLFLSNLMPEKGPLQFLKAAKIVTEKACNVRFVLAGAIWREKFYFELIRYIKKNNLSSHVKVPGGVYGEDKRNLFDVSHIFVFPTQNETFGLVILEAMRSGLPVISSPQGAIPETIEHNKTGFITDPFDTDEIADRILSLVRDPDLRYRMGKRGQERFAREYTTEAYMKKWEGVLSFSQKLLKQ